MKATNPRACKTCNADLPPWSSIYRLVCNGCQAAVKIERKRTHRKLYERTCLQCEVRFEAFRLDMKFCASKCRAAYSRKLRDVGERYSIMERYENKCAVCGDEGHLIVRYHPRHNERVPLCGFHNSQEVRRRFYLRVPVPGVGYARRSGLAKRLAREAAEEAELFKP